jgi:hypothetical protein
MLRPAHLERRRPLAPVELDDRRRTVELEREPRLERDASNCARPSARQRRTVFDETPHASAACSIERPADTSAASRVTRSAVIRRFSRHLGPIMSVRLARARRSFPQV